MRTELIDIPIDRDIEPKDRMVHLECPCQLNKGICGTDLTGTHYTEDSIDCVVCYELAVCPRCGC